MRFGATRSQIYDAQKTARALWEHTEQFWQDDVCRRHREQIVEPLDQTVTDLLRAIDQLAALVTQMRQECEDEGTF
ncbi:MAG: hypothetical protein WHU94_10665 [Thermogemmata sp.]|jgi:hypothetical protein|uniref:Uncharacterized protein n=1 Tax=Thermogemmata fonticola TaxID=2755323 RepID=A0A7V9ADB5_9BACT|nr:hypothetical protein [Thermogemmata fonticola]MBA2227904.1 hypothetical protein [Thermogemmata fonticola]MCX8138612.1 hypothetical protein [Gemmataceae bacterium]